MVRFKCKWFIFLLAGGLITLPAFAQSTIIDQTKKFSQYNPDGEKYEFIKYYLTALKYFETNQIRQDQRPDFNSTNLARSNFIKDQINELLQLNSKLRIAKNIINRYEDSNNGLILKTSKLFSQKCITLISLNNRERQALDDILALKKSGQLEDDGFKPFFHDLKVIERQRKEALSGILEASILASKVLVSDKLNVYEELSYLGVTEKQRSKLIERIKEFKTANISDDLKPGQSFLDGSVSVIYGRLQDDGLKPISK